MSFRRNSSVANFNRSTRASALVWLVALACGLMSASVSQAEEWSFSQQTVGERKVFFLSIARLSIRCIPPGAIEARIQADNGLNGFGPKDLSGTPVVIGWRFGKTGLLSSILSAPVTLSTSGTLEYEGHGDLAPAASDWVVSQDPALFGVVSLLADADEFVIVIDADNPAPSVAGHILPRKMTVTPGGDKTPVRKFAKACRTP